VRIDVPISSGAKVEEEVVVNSFIVELQLG